MEHNIRILLADDHVMVRRGIRSLLKKTSGLEVVGEASSGDEAVALAEQLRPDIVIMDVSMPGLDGLQATARIRDKMLATQVLILSMHNSAVLARQALDMGAQGYVLKRHATDELLTAVEHLTQGEKFLSPELDLDPLAR